MAAGQPIGLSQLELQPPRWGGEHIDGFSRSIRPSAAVADLVEAIWDWDIPDGDAATAFTIRVPPSTAPYFVVQYRTLTHCRWQVRKAKPPIHPRSHCQGHHRSRRRKRRVGWLA